MDETPLTPLRVPWRSNSVSPSPSSSQPPSRTRSAWDLNMDLRAVACFQNGAASPVPDNQEHQQSNCKDVLDSPGSSIGGALLPPSEALGDSARRVLFAFQTSSDRSTFSESAGAAALMISAIVKRFAVGDDPNMEDQWRLSSNSLRNTSLSNQHNALQRKPSMFSVEGSQSSKTLLWYYLQTFIYSVVVALPVFPMAYALSQVPWHIENPDPDARPAFTPNHSAIQWAIFMQCVLSLAMYALVLYWCTMRTFRVPLPLALMTSGVVGMALLVIALFWHYDVSMWYYYLDLLLIAAVFVPAMCAVGWLAAGTEATLKQRIDEVLFVALLETLVAVATLIYTTFLMPFFFTFRSAWLQMLWLCVLHPLYFEVTTAAIVRKALHRNVTLGRTDVVHFLPIVHAMVHMVALNITLQASIEPVRIIALSATLYNVGKLLWRSTVLYRDLFMERLLRRDWSFNYSQEDRSQLGHLICVSVLTELILENAAIMTAPFMLWAMYKEPLFMSVVPNTFFDNDGTYPIINMLAMIAIMFAITWVSDLAFFFLNYYTGQQLPIIYSWRKIKEGKWAYLGFLTYALATMGVMFSFSMMLILPRAVYCKSDNYCDCTLPTYKAICRGEYISMLVDYLIDPW